MEEPGRLQSMGSQRVGHNLATKQQRCFWLAVTFGLFNILPFESCNFLFKKKKVNARIPWKEESHSGNQRNACERKLVLDCMIFSVPNAHVQPLGTRLHSDFQDLLELCPTISRFGPPTVCNTLESELPEDRNHVFLTHTVCWALS